MPVPDGSGMIVGHVVGPDGELPVAGALVRARAHDAAWLAEAHSLADGALSLPIPFAEPGESSVLDVTVEVFDDQGTVQAGAQVVVRPGETVAVTLVVAELDRDRFGHESPVVPPFLAGEAATVLRARVRQRVDRGDLPEGAMAEVDEALRPLEWLSSLQADAHAALRGEPDAADRLRLALLGYVAPVPDDEPVDDLGDVLEHATEPATGPAEGIVDDSGLLAVVAAAVHVAATDAEANLLVGGLSRAAWSGTLRGSPRRSLPDRRPSADAHAHGPAARRSPDAPRRPAGRRQARWRLAGRVLAGREARLAAGSREAQGHPRHPRQPGGRRPGGPLPHTGQQAADRARALPGRRDGAGGEDQAGAAPLRDPVVRQPQRLPG